MNDAALDAQQLAKLSDESHNLAPLIIHLSHFSDDLEKFVNEGIGDKGELDAELQILLKRLELSPITKMVEILERY